jgi:hypothetical protein
MTERRILLILALLLLLLAVAAAWGLGEELRVADRGTPSSVSAC